jgi:hypothetical protein
MRLKATDGAARDYYVYLNGERLTDCIEADEEAGYVVIKPHGFSSQIVRGKVELRRVEDVEVVTRGG